MSIGEIGKAGYPAGYIASKTAGNASGNGFDNTLLSGNDYIKRYTDTVNKTSAMDIYNSMNGARGILPIDLKEEEQNYDKKLSGENKEAKDSNQESETQTDIIVRSDGSRVMVMVMTMNVGGMEVTTSMQISQPTETPNDKSQQDINSRDMPSS